MELSKRLYAVAAMVTPGNVVCDVGCDHGYVSIFLVETKKSPKVYAMDINQGPLNRAKEHVLEAGLQDYIELQLSDGLLNMPEAMADTLICAGMGGRLVVKILSDSMEKVRKMKELVLQPQSEIGVVRAYLRAQGFRIDGEDMVKEDGKYYPILHVCIPQNKTEDNVIENSVRKEKNASEEKEVFDKYGERLLLEKHPVLKEYLLWEQELLEQIAQELEKAGSNKEKTKERFSTLQTDMHLNKEALQYFV